jgi:hypothetical protein
LLLVDIFSMKCSNRNFSISLLLITCFSWSIRKWILELFIFLYEIFWFLFFRSAFLYYYLCVYLSFLLLFQLTLSI